MMFAACTVPAEEAGDSAFFAVAVDLRCTDDPTTLEAHAYTQGNIESIDVVHDEGRAQNLVAGETTANGNVDWMVVWEDTAMETCEAARSLQFYFLVVAGDGEPTEIPASVSDAYTE